MSKKENNPGAPVAQSKSSLIKTLLQDFKTGVHKLMPNLKKREPKRDWFSHTENKLQGIVDKGVSTRYWIVLCS